jgi:hypothetical protein
VLYAKGIIPVLILITAIPPIVVGVRMKRRDDMAYRRVTLDSMTIQKLIEQNPHGDDISFIRIQEEIADFDNAGFAIKSDAIYQLGGNHLSLSIRDTGMGQLILILGVCLSNTSRNP